jgi:hypothetical protein
MKKDKTDRQNEKRQDKTDRQTDRQDERKQTDIMSE